MPNRDGSGNGMRMGRGFNRRNSGGPLGSNFCTCPKCGHKEPHDQRGIPCTQIECPKCKTLMQGEFC